MPRRPGTVVTRALLATVLALGWLLAAALPAVAVQDWGVSSPGAGARITRPVELVGYATAQPAEHVDRVQVRFTVPGGAQYGATRDLSHASGPRDGGRSTWATGLDPLRSWVVDGGAMANGRYRVETRVFYAVATVPAEPTGWRGHDVVLVVPPPKPTATAEEVGPNTAEIRWTTADVPDFVRYAVQRAPGGEGSWTTVAEIPNGRVGRTVDTTPKPGEWRYRVQSVRSDGLGGEVSTTSDPVTVTTEAEPPTTVPTAPPTAPSPEPSSPEPSPSEPAPVDTGEAGDVIPGGDEGDDDSDAPSEGPTGGGTGGDLNGGDRSGGGAAPPRAGSARPPQIGTGGAVSPAPPPPRPNVAGPGENVFEETLDYGELPEHVVTETERELVDAGGFSDGGMLSVLDHEFETRKVLTGLAGMLVLFVSAGHLLRFRDS